MEIRFKLAKWGPGHPRHKTSPENWRKPLAWNREAKALNKRVLVFSASAADIFDPAVNPAWFDEFIDLLIATPHLTWMLLTKRVPHAAATLPAVIRAKTGKDTLPNVWLGCTAENQDYWDLRVPALLAIPAAKHFVSVEPMLGPIVPGVGPKPDWVIVGGESGHGARPMSPVWATDMRDWCVTNSIPFHFKQWGAQAPGRVLAGAIWNQFP